MDTAGSSSNANDALSLGVVGNVDVRSIGEQCGALAKEPQDADVDSVDSEDNGAKSIDISNDGQDQDLPVIADSLSRYLRLGTDRPDDEREHRSREDEEHGSAEDEELHSPDINHQSGIDYLEGLLRVHLDALNEATIDETSRFMLEFIEPKNFGAFVTAIRSLEAADEAAIAGLLRAAIEIHKGAGPAEQVAAADTFLRHCFYQIYDSESLEWVDFLQKCLEWILDRGVEDKEVLMDGDPQAGITVLLGDSRIEVTFAEVLGFFWMDRLDSDCDDCGKPFVGGEPPIRTVTFPDGIGIGVRVVNRHFACIRQRGTSSFVPVSHVWDDSIREASEAGQHNDAASMRLIETLSGLAAGAREAYDKGAEFWHDYFSVPQWNPGLKEALLLRLPIIYHVTDEILVHMADMPHAHVAALVLEFPQPLTLRQALERMMPLRSLGRSQWMDRMWVAIEYAQSRAACIMDASNYVWRGLPRPHPRGGTINGDPAEPAPQDKTNLVFEREYVEFQGNTFYLLLKSIYQRIFVQPYSLTFSRALPMPDALYSRVGDRARNGESLAAGVRTKLTLGEALDIVSEKRCFVPRDRLLAAYVLIEGWDMAWGADADADANSIAAIPRTFDGACDWSWRRAVKENDWSPLLIQPRERGRGTSPPPTATTAAALQEDNETPLFGPSGNLSEFELEAEPEPATTTLTMAALVGRAALGRARCGLGRQFSPSSRAAPVVDILDGKSGTRSMVVRAELDLVGTIEELHFLRTEAAGDIEGVVWAVTLLGEIAKANSKSQLSVDALLDGLDRIFPLDILNRWTAQLGSDRKVLFTELLEHDSRLCDHLEVLMARFFAVEDDDAKMAAERREVAQEMMGLLAMDADVTALISASKITRLSVSRRYARNREKKYGLMGGVPVSVVRCPGCGIVTPEHVDLWPSATPVPTPSEVVGLTLYRIRGLSYGGSAPDGVGLVLDADGRIMGRFLFTPPACRCEMLRTVVIKVD